MPVNVTSNRWESFPKLGRSVLLGAHCRGCRQGPGTQQEGPDPGDDTGGAVQMRGVKHTVWPKDPVS